MPENDYDRMSINKIKRRDRNPLREVLGTIPIGWEPPGRTTILMLYQLSYF